MAAAKKPTPTQLEALRRMAASPDRRLIPLRGGFWTCRGIPTHTVGIGPGSFTAPDWSVTVQTMRAMEQRGWIARANVHAEDWRDERALTDAGLAYVEQVG